MYGAFYGNSNNRLGNYRWNYGGRKSGQTRNTLVESTSFELACPVNDENINPTAFGSPTAKNAKTR